jgi:methionyl-tRNA synthetase
LVTGTDEHGYKIQKKALLENQDCKLFCDKISSKFRNLFDKCKINYSDYIRTTEERHKVAVNHIWRELYANGFIYKSEYEGWYEMK